MSQRSENERSPGRYSPEPGEEPLTDKLRALVDEFVKDYSVTKAAIRAGYAPATARRTGSVALKSPAAQRYLAEVLGELEIERAAVRNLVVDELLPLARFRLSDILYDPTEDLLPPPEDHERLGPIDLRKATPEQLAAITSIKIGRSGLTEVKFVDRMRAFELLGKYAAMFIDRKEIAGPGGGPVKMITSEMTPVEAAQAYADSLNEEEQ